MNKDLEVTSEMLAEEERLAEQRRAKWEKERAQVAPRGNCCNR